MTGRTIATTYTTGINLTNPSDNPVTVLSTGSIANASGPALQAASGIYWTISNGGSIQSSGTTAGDTGILLAGSGAVTNLNTGVVSGYDFGVSVAGSGSLVNDGAIRANQTVRPGYSYNSTTQTFIPLSAGAALGGGGVSNAASAVIAGYFEGVVLGGDGGVANAGRIIGGFGVVLTEGGDVSNTQSGTIGSAAYGIVSLGTNTATIDNQGLIYSEFGIGVDLFNGGLVTNSGTGLIGGDRYGVRISHVSAKVTNSGIIEASTFAGVALLAGGTVTNAAAGTIEGGHYGVGVTGAAGTISNHGSITGEETGVLLLRGGYVYNGPSAGIDGYYFGIQLLSLAGSVTNLGSIASYATFTGSNSFDAAGVDLAAGGSVTNGVSGSIRATWKGVEIGAINAAIGGTLYNQGFIYASNSSGSTGAAVWIHGPGLISNAASGTIAGGPFGVVAYYQTTLVNDGQIAGTEFAFYAVNPGFADRVIVGPGATFSGIVFGGNSAGSSVVSTLEFASGSETGSLSGLGSHYIDFASITIDSRATWNFAGTNTIVSGATLTNAGTVIGQVSLATGALLSNLAGGTIVSGASAAIYGLAGSAGTVVNSGLITNSTYYGINFAAGGSVTNTFGGTIAGADGGIYIAGTSAIVLNDGSVGGGHLAAIALDSGGQVTNQTDGVITGYSFGVGVGIFDAPGTVINDGKISASFQTAVWLADGGTVTNQGDGRITGYAGNFGGADGVAIYNAAGVVTNSGSIDSTAANAVYVFDGQVTNESGGTIVGENAGILFGTTGTVVNDGSISGAGAAYAGVMLKSGGQVTNRSDGRISGIVGIHTGVMDATITNAGEISGSADAVLFDAGSTNRLIIDPGATFNGTVDGGNTLGATSVSTLELAQAAAAGTLASLGSQYINFAQITLDVGASWTLTGTNTLATGSTISNAGTLTLADALLADTGALVNNGVIVLDPSTMTLASLTGTGSVTLDATSTLAVGGSISSGETIVFAGSGAYLDLQNPTIAAGSVINFAVGETIDLKGIAPSAVSYSDGELQINGSNAFPLALADGNTLHIGASADGTQLSALCFCLDTMIATPSGPVKVQDLAVGDLVVTQRGEARPIVWIGAGAVLATPGRRSAATPVIVRKGALGDNVPTHDLRVTKGHSLYLAGALIPVEFLVNHRSIVWDEGAREVKLYHIELATHDVLLANGAPAESYRDDGNRWLFRNANSGWRLPPQQPCAPVLTGGSIVDSMWQQLLDRAGLRPPVPLTDDPDLHLLVDGRRVDFFYKHGAVHVFRLPNPAREVRLVSRAASPQELGLARDPRVLGVAVRRITLSQGRLLRLIEADDPSLDQGFHQFEPDNAFRWTDGDALLPPSLVVDVRGVCELAVHIGCFTRYRRDAATIAA